jgi:hypothetical protein
MIASRVLLDVFAHVEQYLNRIVTPNIRPASLARPRPHADMLHVVLPSVPPSSCFPSCPSLVCGANDARAEHASIEGDAVTE